MPRTIIQQINADGPETYTDGYGVEREMYEPAYIKVARNINKALGNFMYGKDHNLSNDEYYAKYGYGKPIGGAGILEFLSPEELAKLTELEKTLKAADEVKAARKAEQVARNKAIIDNAGSITFNQKTRRPHFRRRIVDDGPKTYSKVEYTPKVKPVVQEVPKTETQKKIDELWVKHNYLIGKAQKAANTGHPGAYDTIMKEANEVKLEIERLSPPDYRLKHGGRLKRR